MRILLDAHALLWWLGEDAKLSSDAREAIETAEEPLIGAGTLVEIAVKRSLGKLPIDRDWPERAQSDGFSVLPISWPHIAQLERLPYLTIGGRKHQDPFDRLLAAQALADMIPIVTRDPALPAYGGATIW
jgi:PIN domain nuclease of toxin-antitoxin system